MFTNWDFLGVFGAIQQELLVIIRDTMKRLGVSPTILEWVNTPNGREAFGRAIEFFAKEYESFLAEANKLLKRAGTSVITFATAHNPDQFFQTRTGLWVSDDFRRLVVAKAQPSQAGASLAVHGNILTRNAKDTEIEAVLPQSHLFGETEVCAIIAGLIAEQPKGQEGRLLNSGYANLFYTASCVVYVYWYAVYRKWYVYTWYRDAYVWSSGSRVFSPAMDA